MMGLLDRPAELRSWTPPLHDRLINWLTDALYGETATAGNRAAVGKWAGPDNPMNLPAQASAGAYGLLGGAQRGDLGQAGGGLLQMGAAALPLAGLLRGPAMTAARISANIHPPPAKPQRPFHDDYGSSHLPQGAPLAADMDGRPLTARFIAGRREAGGADVGLLPHEQEALAAQLATAVRPGAADELGAGVVGRWRHGEILYHPELSAPDRLNVIAHETGHAIRDKAGVPGLSSKAHDGQPRRVYHDLATGEPTMRPWTLPEDLGYASGTASNRERIVEGIRAYIQDPNYLKTVAPRMAAEIRRYVNAHPELSRIIQFNTVAGAGLLSAPDDR